MACFTPAFVWVVLGDTFCFAESDTDLIHLLGPQRGPFGVDSDWLLIWIGEDGRFVRCEVAGEPWVDPLADLNTAPIGSYVNVTMRDGRTVSGYLVERSASTLTVRGIGWTANQRTICEVVDIVRFRSAEHGPGDGDRRY